MQSRVRVREGVRQDRGNVVAIAGYLKNQGVICICALEKSKSENAT